MDSSEIYRSREEFERKVVQEFQFLTTELGFEKPTILSSKEENRHRVEYRHSGQGKRIEILNAYHPVDYGFEINLYHTDGKHEMIFNKRKEDQDPEMQFVSFGVQMLRNMRIIK